MIGYIRPNVFLWTLCDLSQLVNYKLIETWNHKHAKATVVLVVVSIQPNWIECEVYWDYNIGRNKRPV